MTAFALGELSGAEAAAVAAQVAANPILREAVEDVRETVACLQASLEREPLPDAVAVKIPGGNYPLDSRKIARLPYFWVSGLMAAGFAVMVVLHDPASPLKEKEELIHYTLELEPMAAPETQPEQVVEEAQVDPVETAEIVDAKSAKIGAEERATLLMVVTSRTGETGSAQEPAAPSRDEADHGGIEHMSPVVVEITREEARMAVRQNGDERRPIQTVLKETAAEQLAPDTMVSGKSDLVVSNYTNAGLMLGTGDPVEAAATRAEVSPPPRDSYTTETETQQVWQCVADHLRSTMAVDVDVGTGSYAKVRRFVRQGQLPPADAVRIEEMVNAFTYQYAEPDVGDDAPFAASLEVAAAWAPGHRLVRVGLKGREIEAVDQSAANLVFFIAVSGSMEAENKLPLVKEAMRMLVTLLQGDDRVAIVTYAGSSGLALPSTPAGRSREILAALGELQSSGPTNGATGIELAYAIAKENRVENGINRVILCTDGDFNVGATSDGELSALIATQAESGVGLTTLGFGLSNDQDRTLEQWADHGNGEYGFIDSARKARRFLREQVNGPVAPIARDVKVRVDFNPALVDSYRLIGYERRIGAKRGT